MTTYFTGKALKRELDKKGKAYIVCEGKGTKKFLVRIYKNDVIQHVNNVYGKWSKDKNCIFLVRGFYNRNQKHRLIST